MGLARQFQTGLAAADFSRIHNASLWRDPVAHGSPLTD